MIQLIDHRSDSPALTLYKFLGQTLLALVDELSVELALKGGLQRKLEIQLTTKDVSSLRPDFGIISKRLGHILAEMGEDICNRLELDGILWKQVLNRIF